MTNYLIEFGADKIPVDDFLELELREAGEDHKDVVILYYVDGSETKNLKAEFANYQLAKRWFSREAQHIAHVFDTKYGRYYINLYHAHAGPKSMILKNDGELTL
jgi:hypothetical protein